MSGISGISSTNDNYIDAVYEDESSKDVSVDSFLQLMIAQLQNQDFTNPMDDTAYVTQLAQFSTMQQMQELAYYSKSNYVMSMIGKEVTVAKMNLSGVEKVTGPVERISVSNNEYFVYVDGTPYNLNQVMEIMPSANTGDGSEDDEATDLKLSLVSSTDTSATISWQTPTEDEDVDTERLRYSVYYSTSKEFDSVTEIKRGTLVGEEDEVGISEMTIEDLSPNTTYYINVLVKDVDGNIKAYKKQSFTTPAAEEE